MKTNIDNITHYCAAKLLIARNTDQTNPTVSYGIIDARVWVPQQDKPGIWINLDDDKFHKLAPTFELAKSEFWIAWKNYCLKRFHTLVRINITSVTKEN